MLRERVWVARAVVVGDGPLGAAVLAGLRASDLCGSAAPGAADAGLAGAGIVVVDVTPPERTEAVLSDVLARVGPDALVTEVRPDKTEMLLRIEDDLPAGCGYVPAVLRLPPPPGGAQGDLQGATVALVPLAATAPAAIERWRQVWERLGAGRVLQLEPEEAARWAAERPC